VNWRRFRHARVTREARRQKNEIDGKFLLSIGLDSAGMTVYTIDRASGELKPIGHYPMGRQPNWIEIVDLK
jgi:6-phosphogluconolactonase (cycloisomerase 2 family)